MILSWKHLTWRPVWRFVGGTVGAAMMTVTMPAQTSRPLYRSEVFSVYSDRVVQGEYTARAVSAKEMVSDYPVTAEANKEERRWRLESEVDRYPELQSGSSLVDAVYNLSLQELRKDVSAEGTFDAGAKWPGVWTRDVSYSMVLALAAVDPATSMTTLEKKIKRDRIVQDTGTGGSWPCSTDRVVWALAAWEVYLVTGDKGWLERSYNVVRNSVVDDEKVVFDPASGLMRGESSFLDWREQTYPRWMQPADIYESRALGTNVVYARVYEVLAAMAKELGVAGEGWAAKATALREAIHRQLWVEREGFYGQYLYGRNDDAVSPRAEALGESLAMLYDVAPAAQRSRILRSQPLMAFGIPTVYPQTPEIPPYHNRSVWPFVQGFWNLAAARAGDVDAVRYGLACLYRATSLFLTNKENFVLETGSPVGTAVNSDRQLWSVAASLSSVYRVLFGMEFAPDGLRFAPVVPEGFCGGRMTLHGFRYRGAVLTITVEGSGNRVASVAMDGSALIRQIVPAAITGEHSIAIKMSEAVGPGVARPKLIGDAVAPETPVAHVDVDGLHWAAIEGAVQYRVLRNGREIAAVSGTSFPAKSAEDREARFQVAAVDAGGVASFWSEPVALDPVVMEVSVVPFGSEVGFANLQATGSTGLSVRGGVESSGRYALRVRYSNGSGPVNTGNKCAIRTLFVDGKAVGPIVMPQRGDGAWDDYGLSSHQLVELNEGQHVFELRLLPEDRNMNIEVNAARVASIVLLRLH